MDKKFVITIARQYGSGGKTIGEMLSKELGVEYYNKDLILKASEESGINVSLFANADEKSKGLFNKLKYNVTPKNIFYELVIMYF